MSAPQFVARRLRLPCIVFVVTSVRRRREDQQSACTFVVEADGLLELLITMEDMSTHLLRARPSPSRQPFLLVRPWDRSLLELPDLADPPDLSDTDSVEDWSLLPLHASPVGSFGESGSADGSYSRALELIARLGQPFGAFLLAQQQSGEYRRIASDQNIMAQVKDMTAVRDMMDVRTLEIL
jgi:hypothetical protein